MSNVFERGVGSELPSIYLPWYIEDPTWGWVGLDLSLGWTFEWNLLDIHEEWAYADGDGAREDKTAGMLGYDGGVLWSFASGDLDLHSGEWFLRLKAIETATNKDRRYSPAKPVTLVLYD